MIHDIGNVDLLGKYQSERSIFIDANSGKVQDSIDMIDLLGKCQVQSIKVIHFREIYGTDIVNYLMKFDELSEKYPIATELMVVCGSTIFYKGEVIKEPPIITFEEFYNKFVYLKESDDIMKYVKDNLMANFDKSNYEHMAYFMLADYICDYSGNYDVNKEYMNKNYGCVSEFINNNQNVYSVDGFDFTKLYEKIEGIDLKKPIGDFCNIFISSAYRFTMYFVHFRFNQHNKTYKECTFGYEDYVYSEAIRCRVSGYCVNGSEVVFDECAFVNYCVKELNTKIIIEKCSGLENVFIDKSFVGIVEVDGCKIDFSKLSDNIVKINSSEYCVDKTSMNVSSLMKLPSEYRLFCVKVIFYILACIAIVIIYKTKDDKSMPPEYLKIE